MPRSRTILVRAGCVCKGSANISTATTNPGENATAAETVEGCNDAKEALPVPRTDNDDSDAVNPSAGATVDAFPAAPLELPQTTQEVMGSSNIPNDTEREVAVGDGEEAVIEGPEDPRPVRSVPPHMRPNLQPPTVRASGLQASQVR